MLLFSIMRPVNGAMSNALVKREVSDVRDLIGFRKISHIDMDAFYASV